MHDTHVLCLCIGGLCVLVCMVYTGTVVYVFVVHAYCLCVQVVCILVQYVQVL